MSGPLILRPDAEAEVDAIRRYLDGQRTGLGDQFAARLRDVLRQIEAVPKLYGVVWQDVRAVRVRKFSYVVYYLAFDDRTEVIAVVHGAMAPTVWQARADP